MNVNSPIENESTNSHFSKEFNQNVNFPQIDQKIGAKGEIRISSTDSLNTKNNINIIQNNKMFMNSVQQEKYEYIKNFCMKKNDPFNFPLIPYDNFLQIEILNEKKAQVNNLYTEFLNNKKISIELISRFCTLLMNRYLLSNQNRALNIYPKVVYQMILDINNINNFLSPDIVADAKQSNMFICIINFDNIWNILVINQYNNYCNFFIISKNIEQNTILSIMENISKNVYPDKKFKYTISDYSGYNHNVLPFVIMDYCSRNKFNLPVDDEDYYYQTILILSELMEYSLSTK